MIEVKSAGREVCAVTPDGESILVGHIYRQGDRLVPVLLPKFAGNVIASRVMAGALAMTTLAAFSLLPEPKGAA